MSSAAQDFADKIAASFGEKPRHHGRELRVRCPLHEAEGSHKPSLAIWDRGAGRTGMKCMTGCAGAAVRQALQARGVAVTRGGPVSPEAQLAARQANEERRIQSLASARAALSQARPVIKGDAVDLYLSSRQLKVPLFDAVDGFLAARGFSLRDLDTILCGPDPVYAGGVAMICPILDLTTLTKPHPRATGTQSLSLLPDGAPRLDAKTGKKFRSIVGTMQGYGVPFGTPGPCLVVAEGVETMLAAMRLLDIPFGVATLSASNMSALAVPEYVTEVVIAVDNDDAGQSAAATLRGSLRASGWRCHTEMWGDNGSGWDAADEWTKRNTEA